MFAAIFLVNCCHGGIMSMGRVRHWKKRPVLKVTSVVGIALATVLAGTGAVSATTGTAQADTTLPVINLTDPTASVADPIAGMAPVDTECSAGQVDLNTATAAELSAALGLPSDPTVNRLMALRPWLKGADLASVPGIGPDLAAELAPKACATQTVLPAAAPLACAASTQVDLQAAPVGVISSELKLPKSTAEAIVAARPLPQNLKQVIAPRIPGLSQPTLEKLLKSERICVTPAPMLAGGSAWRWATPAGGTVVGRGGFRLIVPPGRVTDALGAYASVTPLPEADDVLPSMDAHIWGAWSSGTTTVAVQGPWQGTGDGIAPVVLHDSGDRGLTMSAGSGVAVSTVEGSPTVTAVQYSLSPTSFGASACNPNGTGSPSSMASSVVCLQSLTDGQLHDQWLANARDYASGAASTVTQEPSCGTVTGSVSVAASLGQLPFGVSCVTDSVDGGGTASWDMTDNASGSVFGGLATLGVLYRYSVHGGTSAADVNGNNETDFVKHLIEQGMTNRSPFLFPGQTLRVSKQINSGETNVDMVSDPGATGAWAAMTDILDTVPGQLFPLWKKVEPFQAEEALSDCSHMDAQGVACLRDAADRAVTALLSRRSLLSSTDRMVYDTARKALTALSVGDWLTQFGFSLAVTFGDGQGVLLRNNSLPSIPDGGSVGSGGTGTEGHTYIARDPSSGRSVLVTSDGTVLNIATGGVFNCLAATWVVWDNATMPALNRRPTANASCADAGTRTWDFNPQSQGGNVPNSVILHERPQDATNGVIASWLINNRGEIQTIPDGGTYLCLGYANPVIWNVPYEKVAAWRPVGTSDASCG